MENISIAPIRLMQRQEKKYLLSISRAALLRGRLKSLLKSDPHNGTLGGYKIRSLYFDTVYDEDYFDKVEGLLHRRKIRLRLYPPVFHIAMLESKEKNGSDQRKRSLKLSREDAESLQRGCYKVLKNYDNDFAQEMYATMTREAYIPKCIVEYNRSAFIGENDTRITLDSDVRAKSSGFGLFDEHIHVMPVIEPGDVVMEVKYKHFLMGYIRDMLSKDCKLESSVSKYEMARAVTLS